MIKKILYIYSIDIFKELYQIDITKNPNQAFNVYIPEHNFYIDIRTYVENQTFISINVDDKSIIQNSPINIFNVNLNFYSDFNEGAFFFVKIDNKLNKNINFENFGEGIELYYGLF